MKLVRLLSCLAVLCPISLLAQKPKLQKPNQPVELKPLIAPQAEVGVPSATRVFEGTIHVRTIPTLKRPKDELPKGFKILTAQNGLPTMISGSLPTAMTRSTTRPARVQQYLEILKPVMGIQNPSEEFITIADEQDDEGINHVKMHQMYREIPVWNGEIIVHERNGRVYLMNGFYFPTPSVENLIPSVSQSQAEQKVVEDLNKKTTFKILDTDALGVIGGSQFRAELVIFHVEDKKDGERLAWHITAYPNILHRWEYFVDAQSGQVLEAYSSSCNIAGHLHKYHQKAHDHNCTDHHTEPIEIAKTVLDGPAVANATDMMGQTRQINTYQIGTNYVLIDASRDMFKPALSTFPNNPVGVIRTFDNRNTDNGPYFFITSTNNTWNNTKAVSAHYNAGQAYLYFKTKFNRNSINGRGGNISSFINVTEDNAQMDNAYWNGEAMFYGNGNQAFTPLPKALDVAGHEISHGVIQNTANLRYQGESGALNESFADIFGAMIDRDDWKMGEDIIKDVASFPNGALRDLSNPHNGGTRLGQPSYQPKFYSERYTGTEDNGGVHINSGIVNYAYYLFASNPSVGKDKAEQIYYTALTKYLVASSKFIDLRAAIEQVCKDRNDNAALAAAQTAFTTVGIGSGGSAGGSNYQKDVQTNTGQDFVVFVSADKSRLQLVQPGSTTVTTLSTKGVKGRPSVTDDGTKIFFVGNDGRIYQITINWASSTFSESVFDNQTFWNNVAISKDGTKLAVNAGDSAIYVYSFALNQTRAFKLYNPTTAKGNIISNEVKFSDALEWDHFGEYVMYDAFNSIDGENNAKIEYWDIGFIRVWDNAVRTWGKGQIEKLFNNLPQYTGVGNPTFAKNSPFIIAFDYYESTLFSTSNYILAANIETGDVTSNNAGIYTNNTFGYPSFSRTDDRLLITTKDGSNNFRLSSIGLESNKIEPRGTLATVLNTAQIGNWFSNGKRVISATEEALDASKVVIAPNPFNSTIAIDLISDKPAQARIDMFDIAGKLIQTTPLSIGVGNNRTNLTTDAIQAGVYFIKINIDGRSLTRKLMKVN